jgi:TatD DNase family protein
MAATTRMRDLPPLDAHAHLRPVRTHDELVDSGAVLAMTISLDEAAVAIARRESHIAWGVGCHPRNVRAQGLFDAERFRQLADQTAVVGEIGLDIGEHYGHAALETQLRTFRAELEIVSQMTRIVSIHSYRATRLVIDELRKTPVIAPILHWWTGNVAETREAVALGCYFSVHSAVARHSKFRTAIPPERILVESDHGYADPPAAIPCRIEWVEHLVGQQLHLHRSGVRHLAWQNLATIVHKTNTIDLLPGPIASIISEVNHSADYQPTLPIRLAETGTDTILA